MEQLDRLEMSHFTPHLRRGGFRLHGDGVEGAPLDLELVEARPLTSASVGDRRQPFAVVFRGPRQPALPQRIYRLEHPEVGAHELFLVPVAESDAGREYEAVFT